MVALVRHFLAGRFLPLDFPGLPIQGQQNELVYIRGLFRTHSTTTATTATARRSAAAALRLILRGRRRRLPGENWREKSRFIGRGIPARRNGCLDKDLIVPNDGS